MGDGGGLQAYTDDTDASSTYPASPASSVRHRCVRCVYTYAVHVLSWFSFCRRGILASNKLCMLYTLAVKTTKLNTRNNLSFGGDVKCLHGRNVKVSARLMSPAPVAVRTTRRKVTAMRIATPVGQHGVGSARTTYLRAKVREYKTVVHQRGNEYIPLWGLNQYPYTYLVVHKTFFARRCCERRGSFHSVV